MKKLLVVVDMQNDFVDGALGTKEAQAIVPNVVKKINDWDGTIIGTLDTHFDNYMETAEGKKLPVPHCIAGTPGHHINKEVFDAMMSRPELDNVMTLRKYTFGSTVLPELIRNAGYDYIELVGLCTDICVISNALMVKAFLPETEVCVDAACCAGVTPESHKNALAAMKPCQIKIENE